MLTGREGASVTRDLLSGWDESSRLNKLRYAAPKEKNDVTKLYDYNERKRNQRCKEKVY